MGSKKNRFLKAIQDRVQEYLQGDEFAEDLKKRLELARREEEYIEQADWIGKTGLPEEWERELPRYLRRELGESIFDDGSMQAADLEYLGAYREEAGLVHYWKVPSDEDDDVFAYIEDFDGVCFGWGDKSPE